MAQEELLPPKAKASEIAVVAPVPRKAPVMRRAPTHAGIDRMEVGRRRQRALAQRERRVIIASMVPVAPVMWPRMDLVPLTGRVAAQVPETRKGASISVGSPSRVAVPRALTSSMSIGGDVPKSVGRVS